MAPPPTDDFEERLSQARKRQRGGSSHDEAPQPSLLGLAYRLAMELVAGVAVGTAIGWFLDRWLGTSPGLLIVFFLLGAAAGFFNVARTARQMNAGQSAPPPPKAAGDDEDD